MKFSIITGSFLTSFVFLQISRWIQQTPEEYIMRYEVVSRVQQVIAKERFIQFSRVNLFGEKCGKNGEAKRI